MKTQKHNDLYLHTGDKGHFYLSLDSKPNGDKFEYGHINANLTVNSNYEAEYKDLDIMPTGDYYEYVKTNDKPNGFVTDYTIARYPLTLSEDVTFVKGLNMIEQVTTVTNGANEPIDISGIAPSQALGVGIGGSKYFETERFRIHYPRCTWCGEAQWQTKTMADLGLYPTCNRRWVISKFRIGDNGSFSTEHYYPLMIIEDLEKCETWFFEREGTENWFIEIQVCEGYDCPFLCVVMGGGEESNGFRITLNPGESHTTRKAFYGVVKGGFEEANKELTTYKRATSLVKFDTIPVCFNDFMNCLWGEPTREKLVPLIDKASEVGCEYFVIDAGWCTHGEWVPNDALFGEGGFKGMMDYIVSKGMKPGIWFEFEMTSYEVAQKLGIKDYLRTRAGKDVSDHRPKVNIRNPEVRKYLKERVKHVYDCGVRFIKNDHNNSEKAGANTYGDCYLVDTRLNAMATESFIDECIRDFPGLVFENCCAGASREEHGMLKHFYLQSYSDQEDYLNAPSILIGQTACIPLEKSGIWSYPYPALSSKKEPQVFTGEELASFSDGEQTAFNMISSMMGLIYLSGKICYADAFNTDLIKEAITTYKSYRHILHNAYPIYPTGRKPMLDRTYQTLGLVANDECYLAVWNFNTDKFEIDLSKYGYGACDILYPINLGGVDYEYSNGILKVEFSKHNQARLFKLTK